MKIKIKSREEIEKTLDGYGYHTDGSYAFMSQRMFNHCDKVLKSVPSDEEGYEVLTVGQDVITDEWYWHKDWYEVVEPDFTEEDLMDIELMDEMLVYFMEGK